MQVQIDVKKTLFKDVEFHDCFLYQDEIYVKVDGDGYHNAIRLGSSEVGDFPETHEVIPVKSVVVHI